METYYNVVPPRSTNYEMTTRPNTPIERNWVKRIISYFSSDSRSMRRGLKQVKLIRAGKIKGKSFDSFLDEL